MHKRDRYWKGSVLRCALPWPARLRFEVSKPRCFKLSSLCFLPNSLLAHILFFHFEHGDFQFIREYLQDFIVSGFGLNVLLSVQRKLGLTDSFPIAERHPRISITSSDSTFDSIHKVGAISRGVAFCRADLATRQRRFYTRDCPVLASSSKRIRNLRPNKPSLLHSLPPRPFQ